MERPVSLYKGVPSAGGICKKAKPEVKAEAIAALSSIPAQDVSEWIDRNVDGVPAKCLPATAKEFGKFVALPAADYAVLLKLINDLKRKIAGG
jgi:hypothetical protein